MQGIKFWLSNAITSLVNVTSISSYVCITLSIYVYLCKHKLTS